METIFPGRTDRFPPKSCEHKTGTPYDLAQIVFLRLGDDEDAWQNRDNPCLSLFSILFSSRLTFPEKQEHLPIIHHSSIPTDNEEVFDNRCTYSQGVLNKGIRKGKIRYASKMIRNHLLTMEQAAQYAGLSLEEFTELYNEQNQSND